jgi:hypothetical protein
LGPEDRRTLVRRIEHGRRIGEKICSVVGRDAFPEDPELIKAIHSLTREHGMKLIELMDLRFDGDGDGEFQVSRELVEDPTPHVP